MSWSSELFEALQKLSALSARLDDVRSAQTRVEAKLDTFLERLTRLEVRQEEMRTSLKNELLADIKADLVRADMMIRAVAQADAGPRRTALPGSSDE